MVTELLTGRFTPGNMGASVAPLARADGRPVVLYGHGAGGDAREWAGKAQFGVPSVVRIARRIKDEGFVGGVCSAPFLYGNAADRQLRLAMLERLTAEGATGPVATMGTSGGNVASLLFWCEHPELRPRIACHVGFLPVVDLEGNRTPEPAGVNGLRPSIDAATGTAWPALLPAAADPNQRRGELSALPQLLFLPGNDPHAVHVQEYADAVGATIVDVGPTGHSDASIAAADLDLAFDFIRSSIALMEAA